jgi:chromosome segregation ATPase
MGKPARRKKRKASSCSGSDTSPKQETKRNDLGEETSFSTESFMAAHSEQDETSPSSSDMWKVLMRIENNTNSLINDFKSLQRNYNELRASLEFSQAKIEELSESNSALETKMEEMKKNNFVLKENMSKMDTKLQESLMKNALLEKKMNEMNIKHDDLEQYTRKYNLEIDGIPQVEDEDLEDIVIKLARSIGADVEPEDIDIVHRFKKGKRQPNPIIVRFNNYYSKKEMYYSRRKLRKVNVRHISGAEKIYINENLTAQRAALFKKVRDKTGYVKDGKYGPLTEKFLLNPIYL